MSVVNLGSFRGRELVQKRGSIGGSRNVFVKLQGIKNELVYPTFGGAIKNPFKGEAKFYAGDLMEYRTNSAGVSPEIYILKTYEAITSNSTTTIYLVRDAYHHIPFVGDTIMVAPDSIGGSGTAAKITSVTANTWTDGNSVVHDVWTITTGQSLSVSAGDVLVESEGFSGTNNTTKAMLVKNINAVADCDCDFFGNASLTFGDDEDTNFDDARYIYAPALGGVMYIQKMSVLPQCVLDLNRSNVNGWFKVDYYDMNSNVSSAEYNADIAIRFQIGTSAPTNATKGVVGSLYMDKTHNKIYVCTAVSSGTTPTYTWVLVGEQNV